MFKRAMTLAMVKSVFCATSEPRLAVPEFIEQIPVKGFVCPHHRIDREIAFGQHSPPAPHPARELWIGNEPYRRLSDLFWHLRRYENSTLLVDRLHIPPYVG